MCISCKKGDLVCWDSRTIHSGQESLKSREKENFHIKRTNVWFSIFLFFVNPGMYKQMMNDDFDVIHAVGIRSFQALIAAMVSKKKNVPLIISDQGGLTTHPDIKQSSFKKRFLIKMQNPLIKYVINQATKIIVPNEYERKIFLEFSDESKISIVKNGIDIDEIKNFNPDFIKKFSTNNYKEEWEDASKGTYYKELKKVPPGKNYLALCDGKKSNFKKNTRFWNFLLKLKKDLPSWTIAAQPGPWIGPFHWDNRRLRVPEIAAIQTFPKNYKFYGNRRSIQKQIGNAVPPLLGKAMVGFLANNL